MSEPAKSPLLEPAGWFVDELGQWNYYSYWRHHYIVGVSHDKAEAMARWQEALKAAMR